LSDEETVEEYWDGLIDIIYAAINGVGERLDKL